MFEELFAKAVVQSFEDELDKLDTMMKNGGILEYTFSERHNEKMKKLFELDRERDKS